MRYFVVLALCVLTLPAPFATAQQPAKPTSETRPADPKPFSVDLNLNVNADTKFYRLAGGVQVENNATNSWTIDTLGFREVRFAFFMGETKKEGSKVSSSSLDVHFSMPEGAEDFEFADQDIAINVGKTSGKTMILPVYGPTTKITVTNKNVSGKLYVLAYTVK